MKSLSFTFFLFFVFTFAAFGQTPTATPPSSDNDDGVVVKISTNLIQIDVVVTDGNGNQVTDLKPGDFEIFENGEKQEIVNFSYIFSKTSGGANERADAPRSAETPGQINVPPPPGRVRLEQIRRTYAIVVDDLGLSFESVPAVRQSIRKFINEQMEEGDLVAIVRTGSGIGALQSFTSDKAQLLAAVEKIRWNSQGRGGTSVFNAIGTTLKEDLEGTVDSQGNVQSPAGTEEEKQLARDIEEFRQENFSTGTLGALNYVIRGMRELPGRKSLMLFSEGFPLLTSYQGTTGPNRIFDSLRAIADLANRSSVVIYTLDPRGLQVPGMAFANDVIREVLPTDFDPTTYTDQRDTRISDFRDSQSSLRYLAYETGGVPFVNQNDLTKGLRQAVADQSGYYLIGYQPDADTFDPSKNRFNKISIKVNRPDINVRYRSGFFSYTDQQRETVRRTPGQQIYGALTSPFGSNGITLSLNTLFAEDQRTGTFIRSLVTINAKDLKFTQDPDGTFRANFDILAMTFGDNGVPIDETAKNYTIHLGAKAFEKVLRNGFVYDLVVPVKKPGAYQFRVALRDSATEQVGSASQFIDVPNLRKNRVALSSIVLENYTIEQWQRRGAETGTNASETELNTGLRQFRPGTVLRYDYIIFNAKTNPLQLRVRARLFRDNEMIVEGDPSLVDPAGQTDLKRIEAAGAITLGKNLAPGNYVLQIIVVDERAGKKYQVTSRWIDFEIVD